MGILWLECLAPRLETEALSDSGWRTRSQHTPRRVFWRHARLQQGDRWPLVYKRAARYLLIPAWPVNGSGGKRLQVCPLPAFEDNRFGGQFFQPAAAGTDQAQVTLKAGGKNRRRGHLFRHQSTRAAASAAVQVDTRRILAPGVAPAVVTGVAIDRGKSNTRNFSVLLIVDLRHEPERSGVKISQLAGPRRCGTPDAGFPVGLCGSRRSRWRKARVRVEQRMVAWNGLAPLGRR